MRLFRNLFRGPLLLCALLSAAFSMPDSGRRTDTCEAEPSLPAHFGVEGGMLDYWEDGSFKFKVGKNGTLGTVSEDVWADTETLLWKSPAGGRIAQFERVIPSSWFNSMGTTYRDFSGMIVSGWEEGDRCDEKKGLFFIRYLKGAGLFSGKSWFGRDPGSYRILSYRDALNGGATSLTLTSESNTYPGGNGHYELKVFEQKKASVPADCRDLQPNYCFQAALQGLCTSTPVIIDGIKPSEECKAKGNHGAMPYIKDCCELSCGTDIKRCEGKDLLDTEPIAVLKATRSADRQRQWDIEVKKDTQVGTDARVLLALATMKTAGMQVGSSSGRRRIGSRQKSYGVTNRNTNAIFGSMANMWLFIIVLGGLGYCFHTASSHTGVY